MNRPSRKSFSSEVLSDNSRSRSVTPRDAGFSHQRSLPRQYTRPRSDRSPSKWRRHRSRSVSSSRRSDSPRGRPRKVTPKDSSSRLKPRSPTSRHRHSKYSRYHRSKSGSPRHRYYRSKSPRSRSPRPYRYRHADLRRESLPRSRLISMPRNDNVVSTLTKLVEQQGQLLKELSGRLDNFSSTSGMAD